MPKRRKKNDPTEASESYSIRIVARLTGISADQLRIWERRYGFPKPQRNGAGNRVYSVSDVRRLTLIARALRAGFRARDAITTPEAQLDRMLASTLVKPVETEPILSSKVEALVELLKAEQAAALRDELHLLSAALGPTRFVTDIASPLVTRVGNGWASGELEVRHEHLLSETLSTQVRRLLSSFDESGAGPNVVLATLPDEQHGLGLEMAALYLAAHGARPKLLGTDTPVEQIARAADALGADVVGISVSESADLNAARRSLTTLRKALSNGVLLWVGGSKAKSLRIRDPRVKVIDDWTKLDAALKSFRRAVPR